VGTAVTEKEARIGQRVMDHHSREPDAIVPIAAQADDVGTDEIVA
jgi:hypothetical protein